MRLFAFAILAMMHLSACATTGGMTQSDLESARKGEPPAAPAAMEMESQAPTDASMSPRPDLIVGDANTISSSVFSWPSDDKATVGTADRETQIANANQSDAPKPKRMVIYTGSLGLRVANVTEARSAVEEMVEQSSGFIVSSTMDRITFRVPPVAFDGTLQRLEKLGEVTERSVSSEDVTDQFFDIQLRLDVAEQSRQRLKAILDKAGAVKDVLEVERDIRRLTEEIEGMKGKLKQLANRVEFATITVSFSVKVFQQPTKPEPRRPKGKLFAWMNTLGVDAVMNALDPEEGLEDSLARRVAGPRARLRSEDAKLAPKSFVSVADLRAQMLAVTPEDYRLRLRVVDLPEKGDLAFWARAVEEELKEYRGYEIRAAEDVKLERSGLAGKVFRCRAAWGGRRWAYDVWLIHKSGSRDEVAVIEFCRIEEDAEKLIPEIEKAIEGMRY